MIDNISFSFIITSILFGFTIIAFVRLSKVVNELKEEKDKDIKNVYESICECNKKINMLEEKLKEK